MTVQNIDVGRRSTEPAECPADCGAAPRPSYVEIALAHDRDYSRPFVAPRTLDGRPNRDVTFDLRVGCQIASNAEPEHVAKHATADSRRKILAVCVRLLRALPADVRGSRQAGQAHDVVILTG